MGYRCKCREQVRIIAGKDYKRLEFFGIHDENSHATNHFKKIKYNQISTIYKSVMVTLKQSATQLRRNLMQARGSPEQHKHMYPAQLRLIQRRVQTAQVKLTKQKLDAVTVPNTWAKAWASSLCGERRKISMPRCASTTIWLMSIASHSFPYMSLVVTTNRNDRLSTLTCRQHGSCSIPSARSKLLDHAAEW